MKKSGKKIRGEKQCSFPPTSYVCCGVAVLAAGVLFLAGCGSRQKSGTEYIRIGFVKYNPNDTFINELTDQFRSDIDGYQTQERRITVNVKDAAWSQRTEDQTVEELIDGGSNILCVNLVDRTAPSRIINMAKERDIPVIFINREPVREDMMLWDKLYYVGSDAEQSGVLQGELAAETIRNDSSIDRNKDGKIQYILLEGEPDHQDAIIRTEKSVSTIRDQGIELEKLSYQIANWSRAQAKTRMAQMISQYGNQIEMVLANNDDMALGTIDAYDQANITETDRPVVFGIDGTKAGLKAVADGDLAGTVYHDTKGEASAIAKLAIALYEENNGVGEGMSRQSGDGHGSVGETGNGSESEADSNDAMAGIDDMSADGDASGAASVSFSDLPLQDGKYIYMSYSKVTEENLSLYYREE